MHVRFEEIMNKIRPVDPNFEKPLRQHLDRLTKPRGSLGRLEDIAVAYLSATEEKKAYIGKKRIYVFAGDHGVVAQGVSAYPGEVTHQMVLNFLSGGAAVNVLARHQGAELFVVDVGVRGEFEPHGSLLNRKIKEGTDDFTTGPAMSEDDMMTALETGINLAAKSAAEGVDILLTGDMGIGNTTASAAIFSSLINVTPETIAGRGTGITDEALERKIMVIEKGLKENKALLRTPLGTLRAVGGFEIAAITGMMLGGAAYRVPVIVDGFISSAAALTAVSVKDEVREYLFFSHLSAERGHDVFFKDLNVRPLLDLGLRLGEGTGAVLALNLIEASLKLFSEMATFEKANVSDRG